MARRIMLKASAPFCSLPHTRGSKKRVYCAYIVVISLIYERGASVRVYRPFSKLLKQHLRGLLRRQTR